MSFIGGWGKCWHTFWGGGTEMLMVADMGEDGVKIHWKCSDVLYGWSLREQNLRAYEPKKSNCYKRGVEI